MSKKSNLKSVRISDEVMTYILNFDGVGFNQKFENLVLFCMAQEKQKRELLASLDRDISKKYVRLNALRQLESQVTRMSYMITDTETQLHKFCGLLDTLGIHTD